VNPQLGRRIAFTLGVLLVCVLGSDIPIPGFDPAALKQLFWGPGQHSSLQHVVAHRTLHLAL
jgi:preprotein translocase subunit SecY